MENNKLQAVLMQELPLEAVHVISNDGSHFQVIAIGEIFNELSRVKKHQVVYEPLIKYIANNTIHSVSIKTYTPEEWAEHNKLNSQYFK